MRKVASSLAVSAVLLLFGCSAGPVSSTFGTGVSPAVKAQGIVHGGQQPISGSTIQLWGLVSSGGGLAPSALISATVTTSDGTGVMNSNANAGNANNTLPVGSFTISGDYTCPGSDPLVYLTATGGNPGLTAGTNNTAIVMIAALTDCNTLKNNAATTFVFVDEVTTIGSLAALYPYASSSGALSATSGQVTAFNTAFAQVSEYTNTSSGSAPGPSLPGGYYASSTEINTLGDIVAPCINSTGLDSNCSTLFNLTKSGSVAPTNIAGAIVNILNNPTQNTAPLFGLGGAVVPFQPELGVAPSTWSLPILQIAATPTFSVAGGTYGVAQFVTLSDTTSGAVIHYTTDGSTPTSASPTYNGTAITVSSSETINAIAQAGGFATSAVGTSAYTITGSTSTYSVNGQVILSNSCGSSLPTTTITLNHGSAVVQTTTTNGSGNFSFSGVPNGTYTVTPSISGPSSVFYPATQTAIVNGGNINGATFNANLGYMVSGTVAYTGSSTGRIYLTLNSTNCGGGGTVGTSISSKGAFTIRGVPPGVYTLNAFMDNLGTGNANASNPSGSTSITLSSANLTGQAVTLNDPGTVTVTSAPTIQGSAGFNTGAVVQYQAVTSNGVETPTSYTLQWSTDPLFGSITGSNTFAANGTKADAWFFGGLTNGSVYYFRAYGSTAATPVGPYSNISSAVTIGAPTGGNTVTGSVTFSGVTATGPLYVGFLSQTNGNFYAEYFASPVSAQAYSIQVPSDTYQFFAILDQNNDGLIDAGDIQDATDSGNGGNAPTVISGPTSNLGLTLPSTSASAVVTTQNYQSISQSGTSQGYNLNFQVNGLIKQPVAVTLTSGPNLINPIDIGVCGSTNSSCGHGFQIYFGIGTTSPTVGDTYVFNVTYSDLTTGTLNAVVSGVLNAFPTSLSPQTGTSVSVQPTFTWVDPANAGSYTYQFSLCCSNNSDIWDIPGQNSNANGFSSSITSIPWGTDPTGGGSTPVPTSLTLNTNYTWQITLQDSNGNSAATQVQYQP